MRDLSGEDISRQLLTAAICLTLLACGQTGDLYLPEDQPETSTPIITIPGQLSDPSEEETQEEPETGQ